MLLIGAKGTASTAAIQKHQPRVVHCKKIEHYLRDKNKVNEK